MNTSGNQLHITVSGQDKPGVLAEVLKYVVASECLVVDIKQFVFNGLLNLSLLVECKDVWKLDSLRHSLSDENVFKELKVLVRPWESELRPDASFGFRQVVTILGRRLGPVALEELTQTLADLDINISRIEQLDYSDHHVLEFAVGARTHEKSVKMLDALVHFKENFSVDLAVQDDTLFRRNKRLIVLDADMTFLQCEVIDELGKLAGKGEEMASITHAAMNGEVDFSEALKQRVRLLKGLPLEKLEQLSQSIPLTPGAQDLVRILKHLGYKVAIVSGGFQFFIERLINRYGLDYGYANRLGFEDGKVSGEIKGVIIDAYEKERILRNLAKQEGCSLEQVVAVGDGANDIHMLAAAGLGIAFNAKPIVQQHAQASLSTSNLELILYFLGIPGSEIQQLREWSRSLSAS